MDLKLIATGVLCAMGLVIGVVNANANTDVSAKTDGNAHGHTQDNTQGHTQDNTHVNPSAELRNLKNFTLSNCLSQAFPDSPVALEAKAAAGAYVETGTLDADAYAEAVQLVQTFLQKTYASKSGQADLLVMKCIDASQSSELDAIAARYSQASQALRSTAAQ